MKTKTQKLLVRAALTLALFSTLILQLATAFAGTKTLSLNSAVWTDSGLGLISPSASSTTTSGLGDTNAPARFYRVEAVQPLTP